MAYYDGQQASKAKLVLVTFEETFSELISCQNRQTSKKWTFDFVSDIQVAVLWKSDGGHGHRIRYRHGYCYNFTLLLMNQPQQPRTFHCELSFIQNQNNQVKKEELKVDERVTLMHSGDAEPITPWTQDVLSQSCGDSAYSIVRITLSLATDKQANKSKTVIAALPQTYLETLSNELVKYLDDNVNTDCILKAGSARIPAHRTVLCARSKVFAAMFRHDTAESRSGEVVIKDIEETMVKDVLYYMYSGKIRGLKSNTAVSMYEVADMYELPELKNACLDFLLRNLTVGNICNAALLAETYSESALETEVLKFVETNLDNIGKSSAWKKFFEEKPLLVNKILFGILSRK